MRYHRLFTAGLLLFAVTVPIFADEPITRDEAHRFAARLASSITAGDPKVFAATFDDDVFLDRAVAGLEIKPEQKTAICRGARYGESLGGQFAGIGRAGGSYTLLNTHLHEGRPQPMLRLITPDGLNYHRLTLRRETADGDIRLVDIDVFVTGEPLSSTIRRLLIPLLAHENRSVLDRLRGSESEFVKSMPQIQAMFNARNRGDHATVCRIYKAMPESVRDSKAMLTTYVMSVQHVDRGDYLKAMDHFEKLFRGDPALLMFKLDAHFLRKEFAKTRDVIEALDKAVGGDPYLDFYRGNSYEAEENMDKAGEYWRKAIEREPSLHEPYWPLLGLALQAEDHAAVAKLLTDVQEKAGAELGDLKKAEGYEKFVSSEEGRKWLADRQPAE